MFVDSSNSVTLDLNIDDLPIGLENLANFNYFVNN